MDASKDEQEVTVEVVPQTVTEIIYLNESDIINTEPNYYIPSEEELEDEENESYQIGSVDPTKLRHMSLILDESQTFVLLSQPDCFDVNVDLDCEVQPDVDEPPEDYNCEVCNTTCHSKKTLNCHKLLHTNVGVLQPVQSSFLCNVCGLSFERAQILSHHFRTSHETPKLLCSICGCPCAHDGALLAHYKKHEPKQFSCDVCNSGYDNPVDLNNHKKTHNTNLLYACNKCDAEFASTAAVSAHLRIAHAKPRAVQSVRNSNGNINSNYASLNNVKVQIDCKGYSDVTNDKEDVIDFAQRTKKKKKLNLT